jgi:hypothetical protein
LIRPSAGHNRLVAGLSPTIPTTQFRNKPVSCGLWKNPPFAAIFA